MAKVIIIGGGWAGCAAAASAKKAGADAVLLERSDMLLGTGLVGGIMRNNGRYTAAEEMIALGGGDLFEICDRCSRHRDIDFPGHKHASLYDIVKVHGQVMQFLKDNGVEIHLMCRITKLNRDNNFIKSVENRDKKVFEGDVFIDATGTAGPPANCIKHGNGCAMCIIRCPSFGGRVSIASMAGIKEYAGTRPDGSLGAMSGSCKLFKESLSQELQNELNKKGVIIVPLPKSLVKDHLGIKACQQYTTRDFSDNVILLDTGHAKLMTPYMSLETLRKVPGFENARYEDPYAGGMGNSMRFFSMAPRDNCMKVKGAENLFCCGEKAGLLVGHTEAIVTGTLAGYNSAMHAIGQSLTELPRVLAVGDAIAYVREQMQTDEGMEKKYTFSGSVFFERMKEKGLYTIDRDTIRKRVDQTSLKGMFNGWR